MGKAEELFPDGNIPAVCVSITGRTKEEILRQAEEAARCDADMAEWRADFCDGIFGGDDVYIGMEKGLLSDLKERLGGKTLLFTVRTKKEGGNADIDENAYKTAVENALDPGLADLVDIEYSAGAELVEELAGLAKEAGVVSILSSHDFDKTPDDTELKKRVAAMDKTGTDMIKIAVMANCEEDVERIYRLSEKMKAGATSGNKVESAGERKNGLVKKPYILISMGELGRRTRFDAEKLGSALTFGALEGNQGSASASGALPENQGPALDIGALEENRASAPGQPSVSELKAEIVKRHRTR